jgi:hypothetical protein
VNNIFIAPLLAVMGGNAGSSKAQVKSASFVLRKLVHYFIENYDWALTKELSDGIIMTMK